MATPRSQAIELSKNTNIERVTIEHYAVLGKIIGTSVDAFFSNSESLQAVRASQDVDSVLPQIRSHLEDAIDATLQTPDFEGMAEHALELHKQRPAFNPNKIGSLDEHLKAGLGTFSITMDGVYDGLTKAFDASLASSPTNASIIDRLAKLHLQHLMAYTETYLRPGVYDFSPFNLFPFKDQFTLDGNGGIKFKPGYPDSASISSRTITPEGDNSTHAYRFLDSTETRQLKDFPIGETPTIGCPITFNSQHINLLWELYATTRRGIELRRPIAEEAITSSQLGTAEPVAQTA